MFFLQWHGCHETRTPSIQPHAMPFKIQYMHSLSSQYLMTEVDIVKANISNLWEFLR